MDKYITPDVLELWFSSTTKADAQLQSVIDTKKFEEVYPSFKDINNHLFRCDNLYTNYVVPELKDSMAYPAHIGVATLNALKNLLGRMPRFGVEVGSFIGSSATFLGNYMKRFDGVLLCIDTWCGDTNMWLMDRFHTQMGKDDGNPKIYDYFMKRMIEEDLTDTVIPFRVSSIVGARALKVLKYKIDFVYLDSAHEAGETFMELMLYHDLLASGGVLFGDDYHGFPAVKHDVDLFCKVHKYTLTFSGDGDTWLIKKQ